MINKYNKKKLKIIKILNIMRKLVVNILFYNFYLRKIKRNIIIKENEFISITEIENI